MWWILAALVGWGCVEREREGDDPGECTDRADNDFDGDFDCDDSDCSGSLDCALVDTGGSDDTSTGDDTAAAGDDTGQAGGDDTDTDTGPNIYTGDTLISAISWNCDSIGYFWFIDYAGWSASADLWFSQTTDSAWSEYHYFTPAVEDPDGYLSSYEFTLDSVYDQGLNAVIESLTTYFDCTVHEGLHIFQFDLWNEAGDTRADCALFGDDPDGDTAPFSIGAGAGWPGDCNNLW